MKKELQNFKSNNFYSALEDFFAHLNIPVNHVTQEPIPVHELFETPIKALDSISKIYFLGMVDDAIFNGISSKVDPLQKIDYDGILIFGVELSIDNPTRSILADISRAFNREYKYTPITIVFKYNHNITFSNTERLEYKQNWREGEKAGKVSLLRDIDIDNPHTAHMQILQDLSIARTGKNAVNSFMELYKYWQSVFSVSVLNKQFYRELSNWYFWAIKEVRFPGAPQGTDNNAVEVRREHNAKNIIRLLTRLLFVWFIKEKKLIPNELFDEQYIKDKLLVDFEPQKSIGLFTGSDQESKYYKAILQNLFFATLNQEMGKRSFRNEGQHRNITNLMRYENYFKDSQLFLNLMEEYVPFMNGGLFECLDKPDPEKKGTQGGEVIIYEDGFSDRKDNSLVVPDYIFFGIEKHVDLSAEYGSNNKAYKDAAVKGLINILKSYKFTITENTPIEEDVALDPELLGKVFENLLASYNPETKNTARKQTGSFYTPREIVSYMVDESLIVYLRNHLTDLYSDPQELDSKLYQLLSYNNLQPFEDKATINRIISAIDKVTILDPAVGSGAFPMGALQKMVHLLHKLDPRNERWKQRQINRVQKLIDGLDEYEDSTIDKNKALKELQEQINDIEEAFNNNELDYGRKLYLIENCIYGVDIQPIAVQISKLRFFISLIVDQKMCPSKNNFGIRPLPNLESKFVTANTLYAIEKPTNSLFSNPKINQLELDLKKVRHKLFSAKTHSLKEKLRLKDLELRKQITQNLINDGWSNDSAEKVSRWDPYNQNHSASFFDSEWMFGITENFDIVIGNPPYANSKIISERDREYYKTAFNEIIYTDLDLYEIFMYKSCKYLLKDCGCISFIVPNSYFTNTSFIKLRDYILHNMNILHIVDMPYRFFPFENVNTETSIFVFEKRKTLHHKVVINTIQKDKFKTVPIHMHAYRIQNFPILEAQNSFFINLTQIDQDILSNVENINFTEYFKVSNPSSLDRKERYPRNYDKCLFFEDDITSDLILKNDCVPALEGSNILRYKLHGDKKYTNLTSKSGKTINGKTLQIMREPKIVSQRITGQAKYRLVASLDTDKYVTMPSVNIINVVKDVSDQKKIEYLNALLLILNSSIYNYLYKQFFAETNTNITSDVFETIPIPNQIIDKFLPISNFLVTCLLKSSNTKYFHVLDSVANAFVLELYLSKYMEAKDIEIIKYIENDIILATEKSDLLLFDCNRYENILEKLYSLWTHPDNQLRNRMKLFSIRSPEIIKPILEN